MTGTTSSACFPVAVHEAVLGARIDVPTLDGPVKLRIPPGTQAGQRLRGERPRRCRTLRGVAAISLFEVRLVLPSALDERSQELMREFATDAHARTSGPR